MIESTIATDRRIRPQPGGLTDLLRGSPWHAPITLGLLALNIAVFALMLGHGASLWHTSNAVQLAWGANFGPATQDGQWWRLATALFLHFGVVHLALNMWALWDVGRLVERLLGWPWFVLLYLASGVIGNLLSLVLHGNQAVSGGASGAIFSLYGALLVFLWRERRQVDRREFRWLFGAAMAFTVVSLGMGLLVPGIDNAAHMGGLVAGALLGRVLGRPARKSGPRALDGKWRAGLLLALLVLALATHVPSPSYRMREELRARDAIQQFLKEDRGISERWDAILDAARRDGLPFDQVAGRIETNVSADYKKNFERLSALNLDSAAPSAQALGVLRKYAALRADASQALAQGLRTKDPDKIRKALESARRATELARSAKPPAPAATPDKKD